ncbi:nuclear transport factor 2 family protein [Mycobacterium hackensackense]|uniref:YybH family protein n=1 Tax=Mycobacterium hackensackense TaxID=228909 RepID=UPI002265B12C|nr:nuclear transport factor 2 family protein [Mycobacterium hackensackense]MCV7252679.1 nuclear transport factor 2 family protein [Mycobacterium hackensackense]
MNQEDVLAAADELVAAFAATDTAAYFACFSPDATFVFHPEDSRLDSRAAYEAVWANWLDAGWRVVSCTSSHRLVQLFGDVAVFTHTVRTTTSDGGVETTSDERETIVFTRDGDRLLAVHEHLSPVPSQD